MASAMKNTRNRLTYILTSVGEKKIVNTLAKEYINPRNRIKWIQMQLKHNSLTISRDTIHKMLTKQRVEEYVIKSVFEALKLSYESNIDSVPASKETSVTDSCHQDFFPVENKGANFFGRDDDLKKLNTLFNQHQKMIVIQAPGGTGKTTLAKQYLDNHGFDLVLSLEMARETENITSIESIVEEWLKQYFQEEPGREFGITLIRLKKHLQNRRVGILIDNLEPALNKHGKFIQNHSRYLELLKILADATVQSFTIITSRECLFDDQIDVIYHYYLSRLSGSAWQEFFAFHEVEIDISLLEEMHIKYGGNAKAMHILLGSIKTNYEGDATAYWQENCTLVERGLKNLVVNQFERLQSLNPNAYKLLCRLGCYRYQDILQVTEDALLALLWDIPNHQWCIYIIRTLRNLRLVEFVNGKYWLHPVIREESIKRLKSSQEWEEVNRKAAEFWRGSVKNIRTSEDTKKAFEAYYHYECIHDFENAGYVLIERRNNSFSPDETLAISYHRAVGCVQIMSILDFIMKNIKSQYIIASIYSIKGVINMLLGDINIAINYDNKSLALANSLLDGFENNKIDTKYDDIILLILKNKIYLSMCYVDRWELEAGLNILELTKSWLATIMGKVSPSLNLKIKRYQIHISMQLAVIYSYLNLEKTSVVNKFFTKRLSYGFLAQVLAERLSYVVAHIPHPPVSQSVISDF
ncbi:ATP-binding protein [Dolichospermum sp. ST_sed6]|nr:ATP-binding protein [Dolichospermum sp. ST_sed6]MDD1437808.1 ATP-binding protein [Dolichospermum sp. ST_sed10]MDD1468704.1 ATP-binding protein [Dolichospermum sp. ST_sed5]